MKHYWIQSSDVPPEMDVSYTGYKRKSRYIVSYRCRNCGALVTAPANQKIHSKVWKDAGILVCEDQLVKNVMGE